MAKPLRKRHFDVVVVGGGPAGLAAAISAARGGADTLLLESAPFVGGELLSGLPIDGCLNARGEWIVGGILKELLAGCEELGGCIGPVCDWRLMWAVCVDPEAMKIATVDALARHKLTPCLYTLAEDAVVEAGRVKHVVAVNKSERMLLSADVFIDCSGDADLAVMAGTASEKGGPNAEFQPLTLVFRMSGADYGKLLEFVQQHPEEFILGENPVWGRSPAECAAELVRSGHPFAGLSARASLLGGAIAAGEMYPCTALYMWPTSLPRRELGFNTTRVADVDATDTEALSASLPTLASQVRTAARFGRRRVPGLADACLSGVAPRVGVRETRRIVGEYVLTAEDVIQGRKRSDGIAKGGHHVDVHGSGTYQKRTPVAGGQSYDIPYGCLVPRGLANMLVAGRCLSSTREANGSARVMGPCVATGEAAGAAAAMVVRRKWDDVRRVPVDELRAALSAAGAILEGTH